MRRRTQAVKQPQNVQSDVAARQFCQNSSNVTGFAHSQHVEHGLCNPNNCRTCCRTRKEQALLDILHEIEAYARTYYKQANSHIT
jgi:hypothetical protein